MQRLIIVAALALSCAPPSGGGGRADGTGAPGEAGALDAAAGDGGGGGGEAGLRDSGPDGPPARSCDELLAAIRGAVADPQRCLLDTQCFAIGGPQGCECGPVVGDLSGYAMHFNVARGAFSAYVEALERCAGDGQEVCDTHPSTAHCTERGRCELDPGGACVPDGGVGDPDAALPDPMCPRLRDALFETVAAEGGCERDGDCAIVAGSAGCACNLHEGPPGGYGINRAAAERAQALVDMLHASGCPERESCGVPPAKDRAPTCVGGTCRAGEPPTGCDE